jgi:hypothetical protein
VLKLGAVIKAMSERATHSCIPRKWQMCRVRRLPPIGKAATLVMLQPSAPAREPTAWIHAPSQPLMQSLLSQFQTPTVPRRVSRFFRVRLPFRLPCRADHSAYFGWTSFISPILSAVDVSQAKQLLDCCQRNSQRNRKISVNVIVENAALTRSRLRNETRLNSYLPRWTIRQVYSSSISSGANVF